MLFRKFRIATGLVLALALSNGFAQDKKPKEFIDRAEYDLTQEIAKATDANKKLELLNQWKEKYPQSQYDWERMGLYLTTYQQLGKAPEMMATAKTIAAADPKQMIGPYYIVLLTQSMQAKDPATLEEGEKAAHQLISGIDDYFAASKKPATVTDEQWAKQKEDVLDKAYGTLVYVSTVKKDYPELEKRLTDYLKFKPNNAQASYQLGAAILGERKPEKQTTALYHFARAAALTGPGELPAANKKPVVDYFTRIYSQFRGDKKGMDELMARSVKDGPFPQGPIEIKTKQQEDMEQLEELKKTNPSLAVWVQVKQALTGPDAANYFASSVKDSALTLKGKVVSTEPAVKPKKIIIGISDATVPEVTLNITDGFMPGKAEPGTELEFTGTAKEFTTDPFMLSLDTEKANIKGWPAQAAAPAHRAPVRRATPKKK